jgi:hypothetical protein
MSTDGIVVSLALAGFLAVMFAVLHWGPEIIDFLDPSFAEEDAP